MKRIIITLFVACIAISLFSCGEKPTAETSKNIAATETKEKTTTENIPKTPIEELSVEEKALYEVIKNITSTFVDPASGRLVEIGERSGSGANYLGHVKPFGEGAELTRILNAGAFKFGNGYYQVLDLKIQGKNQVGGTVNAYFSVRWDSSPNYIYTKEGQTREELAKEQWDSAPEDGFVRSYFEDFESYLNYMNLFPDGYFCSVEEENQNFGRWIELEDTYVISNSLEGTFDIAKINKALKYYWDQRLGNN